MIIFAVILMAVTLLLRCYLLKQYISDNYKTCSGLLPEKYFCRNIENRLYSKAIIQIQDRFESIVVE
jgi:hypothetical protein